MPNDYEAFRTLLSDRPIAFHPSLARLFGGINEALFFQQIAYWSGKGDDPEWIYKTREEIESETCLSRYQQEQARKTLVKLGVLEETKRGLPAKLYYRINWDKLYDLHGSRTKDARNSQSRMRETDQQQGEKLTNSRERNSPSITKTTAKTTQRDNGPDETTKDETEILLLRKAESDDTQPPPVADLDRYREMTPEERLAQFEATQSTLKRLPRLS